jgi:cation diffusion facilitator family transporter
MGRGAELCGSRLSYTLRVHADKPCRTLADAPAPGLRALPKPRAGKFTTRPERQDALRDAMPDEQHPEPQDETQDLRDAPHDPKATLALRAHRVGSRLLALHVLLCVAKCVGGVFGGSYALVLDGVNSLREVGSRLPTLFQYRRVGGRPHARHPYDQGKIEDTARHGSCFALLVAAGVLGTVAVWRLRSPHAPPGLIVAVVAGLSIGLSEGMHRMQRRLAAQLRSPTLTINRGRRRTDVAATAAAFLGPVAAYVGGPGLWFCDDIAALVVALCMAYGAASTLWRPGLQVVADAPRADVIASVEACARRFAADGFVDARSAAARVLGSHYVVELRVVVAPETAAHEGQRLGERIRAHMLYLTPNLHDVVVRVEPRAPVSDDDQDA